MCELRDDVQKLQEQIVGTLLLRKEEIEATDRSFGEGSGGEDAAIILSSSPPIKTTKNPNKSPNTTANTVTPEATTGPDAKKNLHSNIPTKLLQKMRHFDSGFSTKNATKLLTNVPTKALRVVPTTNVNKPSTKQSTVFKTETNTSNTKPPKKTPDPR